MSHRRRTAATAVCAAGLALVSACSSPADGGSATPAAPASAAATAAGTAGPTPLAGTAQAGVEASGLVPPNTVPGPVTTIKAEITDPALGHTITITQIQRDWPWPADYSVPAQVFELVAVKMTWKVGSVYTAWLSPDMFTIGSGSTYPNTVDPIIDSVLKAKGYPLLPGKVLHGKTATGWLVFKVEPKDAPKLTLTYTRPKIEVSGGGSLPSKTFSTTLVGG